MTERYHQRATCRRVEDLGPGAQSCATCGSTLAPPAGPVLVSPGHVGIVALIDEAIHAVPASVQGLDAATTWLDRHHGEAGTAAFYRAERVGNHPNLICGGVYRPGPELALLNRRAVA